MKSIFKKDDVLVVVAREGIEVDKKNYMDSDDLQIGDILVVDTYENGYSCRSDGDAVVIGTVRRQDGKEGMEESYWHLASNFVKIGVLSLMVFVFASCGVHKNIARSYVKEDSTASQHKDSTVKKDFTDSSDYLYLQDASVTVVYQDTTVKTTDTTPIKSPILQGLRDVVKAVTPNGAKVKSITVHIGSLIDSSRVIRNKDSVAVKSSDTVSVNKTVRTYSKVVNKKVFPLWLDILLIVIVLGGLLYVVYKAYTAIFPTGKLFSWLTKILNMKFLLLVLCLTFTGLCAKPQSYESGTAGSKNITIGQAFKHCASSISYWVWIAAAVAVAGAGWYGVVKSIQASGFSIGIGLLAFAVTMLLMLAIFMRPSEVAANTSVDQAAKGIYIGY
jgi:hypothetical protein